MLIFVPLHSLSFSFFFKPLFSPLLQTLFFLRFIYHCHCPLRHLSPLPPQCLLLFSCRDIHLVSLFCSLLHSCLAFTFPFSVLPPPRPDLSPNRFSSFSFHLHFSLDHLISLPVFPAALLHLPTPLAASCHFYFRLPNFGGQNVKFTQDPLALSLLYFYFFAPLSGPPPIFGRRRMESSPNWPKLKVLTCASRCSTNQTMVSTSAKLTTASGTARGSTHFWCKVKDTGGGLSRMRDAWWGRCRERVVLFFFMFLHHFFKALTLVACTSIFFLL